MTIIRIGDKTETQIEIDSQQRKVTIANQAVELPERSYRLLITLVENAPNIVSHDQLMKAVWPDTVVSDETLKQRVSRLRKQLSALNSQANDYFIAERGLGYRCTATIAKVEPQTPVLTEQQLEQQERLKREEQRKKEQPLKIIYACILVTVVLVALWLPTLDLNKQPESGAQPQSELEQTEKEQTSGIAPQLTPDDYENQARQYYYRFNNAANDAAINLYQQALKIDPNYVLGYSGLANAHAQGYYQYGKDQQWLNLSLQYSKQAIEIDPQQPWGHKSLGLGLYLNGQHQQAINSYQKAAELATWWASPVNNSALAQMEIGQLTEAYQNAIKAIQLDPKAPIPYLFLGLIYRDLAMYGHANNAINRALNFKPDYNLAQSYQAEFYLINNQYQQAIDTAKLALNSNSNNQLAYWVMAQAHLYLQQNTQAINALEPAATLGGRYQLISESYLAILKHQPTTQIKQQLSSVIEQGNQWFEYPLALSALSLANNHTQDSLRYLQIAIDAGLNHPNRLKNSPFFKTIQQNSNFQQLIEQLENKIAKQRHQVIQIEQSRDF